jgi:hypothetical protein
VSSNNSSTFNWNKLNRLIPPLNESANMPYKKNKKIKIKIKIKNIKN